CSNKRGVFLSLLLERLEALNTSSFVRVGLSATQRPLEEVSKYLGGWCSTVDCSEPRHRPVRIVDAGARRGMDLKVAAPGAQIGQLTFGPVWPAIEARLRDWIPSHRSTIVFANNRRQAERLTARLNESFIDVALESDVDDSPNPVPRYELRAESHHG